MDVSAEVWLTQDTACHGNTYMCDVTCYGDGEILCAMFIVLSWDLVFFFFFLCYFVFFFFFVFFCIFFFFQAEDGIRDKLVTGVQTCALPI